VVTIPEDIDEAIGEAWDEAKDAPGSLTKEEARLLGVLAACNPAQGTIVEVSSFASRSTIMLAKVAAHYGLGPIVTIVPSESDAPAAVSGGKPQASYEHFVLCLRLAHVSQHVQVRRGIIKDSGETWDGPIRLLRIDGEHSYKSVKRDFDYFQPHITPLGFVLLHEVMNTFSGPIRVFLEGVLRSDQFGPAGIVGRHGWAQFRPQDGGDFLQRRSELAGPVSQLLPFVIDERAPRGLAKIQFKLKRMQVSRSRIRPQAWAELLADSPEVVPASKQAQNNESK
jgi:hypothetical protein